MTFSIFQKFQIFVVRVIISILWYLEGVSVTSLRFTLQPAISGFSVGILNISLLFFAYVCTSNYMNWLGNGINAYTYHFESSPIKINKALVLGSADSSDSFPLKVNEIKFPELTAEAVLVVDRKTGKILYEKNSSERLASASTTKLMTALVAFDIYDLDELIEISKLCSEVDSTKANLPVGTKFRVKDLLNVMLISSAGDAACALSESKVSTNEFIYKMNQKAYQLGLKGTFFTNAIGLDGLNSAHFSNAADLYNLAVEAVSNRTIAGIVKTKEYVIKSEGEEYIGTVETTNKLLWEIPQSVGIKTGTTAEAGQVLIYEYQDDLRDLVIIVMGSVDRFSDTRSLLNWAFASYSWE